MRKRNNPPTGHDWTPTCVALPEEREAVQTCNKNLWNGFTEPVTLRRKGEYWFFSDWSQRVYRQPEYWRRIQN